jgi:tetratricopeptide (TPR) repeat protein
LRSSPIYRITLSLTIICAALSGCSRDPNVRKHKYFQSGMRYFDQGKYPEASIQFSNAVKIDPAYTDAHYQLAQSYLKTEQFVRAFQEFARTVELQPDNYQARIAMTNLLIAGHEFKEAQEQTEVLLQKWPTDPQSYVTLSSLLAAQGNFSGAVEAMQKAIVANPSRWESYLNLALLQIKNQQADAAETSFRKALELNPKAVDAHLLYGSYLQSRGRFSEAETQFSNAIASDPGNPILYADLARLYMVEGKEANAEAFLAEAKQKFPDNSAGYRMLGDFFLTAGKLDQAVAEYASLYRAHPKDIQVKKNYVQVLILRNRLEDAQTLTDEILKANGNDNDGLLYRGQIQIRLGHANEAVATLQTLTKNDPENGVSHYYLGVAIEASGDSAHAAEEWRTASRLRPDLIEPQRALAGYALRKGDMSALEQAATQVIVLQPKSPDGYALRAISNINRRQFAQAETDARKAIDVAPQSPVGYVQIGGLNFVQKKYSTAEKAYRDALDRDVNSTDALRGLMNTFLAQNQVDKAIAAANIQIAKAPTNAGFYSLLGATLFKDTKDLDGAEAAFAKAVEIDKNSVGAWIKLGKVQAANGETQKALATYQEAVKNNPREADFYILMGELYESKQDWSHAGDAYQEALGLKSQNPLASEKLASVMTRSGGNLDVALSLAQTARQGLPDSPEAADTLGWIYYQKGVYRSAIDMFQEALRLSEKEQSPDNADIHYHLGLAYAKASQSTLARQQLERVLKINPNYSDAGEIKKELARLQS